MFIYLKLARVGDDNTSSENSAVLSLSELGDLVDELHGGFTRNLSENDVLAVEVVEWDGGDEELGAVGVLAGVGHGEETWLGVLVDEVLVLKLLTVDGLASSTLLFPAMCKHHVFVASVTGRIYLGPTYVSTGEVATLQHEVINDTVEVRVLVTVSLLSGAESTEVL